MRFTPLAVAAGLSVAAATEAQVNITEVRTGPSNTEYVELRGTPGASLGGLTLLIIGDGVGGSGVVEWRYPFDATDVLGPNGYLVLRNPGSASAPFGLTVDPQATDLPWPVPQSGNDLDSQIEAEDNLTLLLVSGYSGTDTFVTRAPGNGSNGQDLDIDDDGTLDILPWTAVVDSMVVKASGGTAPPPGQEWWYEPQSVRWCGPYQQRSVETVTTGGILAYWNENTNNLPGGGFGYLATAFPKAAASGSLAVPATLRPGGGVTAETAANANGDVVYRWIESFGGSALGALPGDVAGGSLCIEGGTVPEPGGTPGNNGAYFEFRLSMSGRTGLKVKYATRNSPTGFQSQQVSYSTDGTNFTNIGEPVTGISTTFALVERDLGSVLDGAPQAFVRITFSGAISADGNNRLDNIQLLSQPTTEQQVVIANSAPIHCIKSASASWMIGKPVPAEDAFDTPGRTNAVPPTFGCGDPGAGDCSVAHDNGACADACCCEEICKADSFCCEVRWDAICATAFADCSGDCSGCIADLNGNGIVNGDDLGILLTAWGAGAGSPADLNGNGIVNGDDLGILLVAWGACPAG